MAISLPDQTPQIVEIAALANERTPFRLGLSAVMAAVLFLFVGQFLGIAWLATIMLLEAIAWALRERILAADLTPVVLYRLTISLISLTWVTHAVLLWRADGEILHIAAIMDLFSLALYGVIATYQDRALLLVMVAPPLFTLSIVLLGYLFQGGPTILGVCCGVATVGTCAMFLVNGLAMHESDRKLRRANARLSDLSKELELSNRFLEEVSNVSEIGGWKIDAGTRQLFWTDWARRHHDVDPDYQPQLSEALAFCDPPGRESLVEAIDRGLQTGTSFDLDLAVTTRRKRAIRLRAVGKGMTTEGRLTGLIGAFEDITEQRQTEARLVELAAAAEAANRGKDAFLANMSHDLRTPLNGIIGLAGSLARTALDDTQREMAELILSSGETLERLVSDLLDVSLIKSGHLKIRLEPFDLAAAIETAIYPVRARAAAKGIDFAVSYAGGTGANLIGDPIRVGQIVTNLTANAVKFTDHGSVAVTVELEDMLPADAPVMARITVADTGIGYDEAFADRIFEPFVQAEEAIGVRYGGTGLGLAICKGLVAAMGGTLTAKSIAGSGTTFIVSLPLRLDAGEADAAPWAPATEMSTGLTGALKILVVEDHFVNQRYFSLILESLGHEVTVRSNGREALDALTAATFDVILMDMQMPVMDGLEATRAIRRMEVEDRRAATPIVMLTGNALPEHVALAHEAGCDEHLAKPVSTDALLQVIRRIEAERARQALTPL